MSANIVINGKNAEAKNDSTISDILKERDIKEGVVTVELNGEMLDKGKYSTSKIKDGDKLEFVYYMGGGGTYA